MLIDSLYEITEPMFFNILLGVPLIIPIIGLFFRTYIIHRLYVRTGKWGEMSHYKWDDLPLTTTDNSEALAQWVVMWIAGMVMMILIMIGITWPIIPIVLSTVAIIVYAFIRFTMRCREKQEFYEALSGEE